MAPLKEERNKWHFFKAWIWIKGKKVKTAD
jgi:hypothetical protein